jgi:oxygen-dependent protoporphyrinogen oxidase
MIGQLDWSQRQVHIVGGGISGLTSAWCLAKQGFEVEISEASNRWGGLIETQQFSEGFAEAAIHSFLETPEVAAFLDEVGVERSPVRPTGRARYIYREGRARKFPLRLSEALVLTKRLLTTRGLDPQVPIDELTLEQWGERFLGTAGVTYLLNPMLRGIYAARPSELSLLSTFPRFAPERGETFLQALKRTRKARPRMVAALRGSEAIVKVLVEKLERHPQVQMKLNHRVEKIDPKTNTLFTVPAFVAAELVQNGEAASLLKKIQYLPLVTVTTFVDQPMQSLKQGTGTLFPEIEKTRSLGILFNSSAFPGRVTDESKYASFTCIMGGSSQPEVAHESDDQIQSRVNEDLARALGVPVRPVRYVIRRWPRALPVYSPEHRKILRELQKTLNRTPGQALFGNYTGEISARGIWQQALAWKPESPRAQ